MNILMPQLGETVAEGKITTWFKTVGDAVKPGDNLFEIETDKVSMEVPATTAGVLSEIRIPAGSVVPVGVIVAVISEPGAAAAAAADPPDKRSPSAPAKDPPAIPPAMRQPRAPAAAPAAIATHMGPPLDPFHAVRTPPRNHGPARIAGGRTVSPLARRLASEAGIDLTRIAPSGAHGRILARDVERAIADSAGASARAAAPGGLSAERVKALYEAGAYEEVALDAMRQTIATRLVQAKQTVPHFYLACDVCIDRVEALRREANAPAPSIAGTDGVPALKLSLTDFIVKALARALVAVPVANAVWAEDRILRFRAVDIAVAVALDDGLITPVIRGVEAKSLTVISAGLRDLAARARARHLQPAEYQGGVSTVSNLGMHSVREFAGVINPPQSTLLAVGAAERLPVEHADGGVRFETRVTVTLSCDHRLIDGAVGAALLAAFKQAIEHPVMLLL
ncbi:MAG: dihydrolipoamide acetyltransferase family protein [Xanthobacteraceae bacterium]